MSLSSLFFLLALLSASAALPCSQYEDEFEPNPGTLHANQRVIYAPILQPTLLWSNDLQPTANTSKIWLTALQLCSTDADGGIDAFQFRVARVASNSSPRGLIEIRVDSVPTQTKITLEVDRVVGNYSSLEPVVFGLGTEDVSVVAFATELATVEEGGTLFLARIKFVEAKNSDASPYQLIISLPNVTEVCGSQAANLQTGVVTAPGPASASGLKEFLLEYTISACADMRIDFPPNWFGANDFPFLYALAEYPYFPFMSKTALGFVPGGNTSAPCCPLQSANVEKSGNAILELYPANFSVSDRTAVSSAYVRFMIGRRPIRAYFYAVSCSDWDVSGWPVLFGSNSSNWAAVNQFPPSSLCARNREFSFPLSDFSASGHGALWIKAERTNAWLAGSPAISGVVFKRQDGSTVPGTPQFKSQTDRMLNAVVIDRAIVVSAEQSGAVEAFVTVSTTRWFKSEIDLPYMLSVTVSYWGESSLQYDCPNMNASAGFDYATFTLCPFSQRTAIITPDISGGDYDLLIGVEMQATNLSSADRVEARISSSVPLLASAGIWDGIDPIPFNGAASIRLPIRVFRPFGPNTPLADVETIFYNDNGMPLSLRFYTTKMRCTPDAYFNDDVSFGLQPFTMPAIPTGSTISATICGQTNDNFQFPIGGADVIEVRSFFPSLSSNLAIGVERGQPQDYRVDLLDLAIMDSGGNIIIRDDNPNSLAAWGRSAVVFPQGLSPAPLMDTLFAKVLNQYTVSTDYVMEVVRRNFWTTVGGYTIDPAINPTTGVPAPVTTTAVFNAASSEPAESSASPVGIVIAVIAVVLVLILCVAFALWRWRSRSWSNDAELVDVAPSNENYGALGPSSPSSPPSGYASAGSLFNPTSSPGAGYDALPGVSHGSPGKITPRLGAARVGGQLHGDDAWSIRYEELVLDQEIGRGAFGTVYRGRWRATPVAVKQVADHAMTERALAEFFSEAQLMKDLRPHANVVALLGVCASPLCLITEFLAKGSLADFLDSPTGTMTAEQRYGTMLGIARGVLHLHLENIIHRDLAARNVLLTASLEPKISDFGLSRVDDGADNKTVSEVGPLKWMSPENILRRTFSNKSDVWSFGVTIVELFTRDRPYPGMDGLSVAAQVSAGTLIPELPLSAPQLVHDILLNCWQYDPAARPDMAAVVASIEVISPSDC